MTLQQEANNKSSESGSLSSSRKVHKADREKLRRDKLNEQFAELAAVLDPEKPKLDKASILGDSLLAVRDLRNEIKRLRTERGTLFDESRDLTREKCDLEEEKAALQKQTDELEVQLQQVLKAAMMLNSNNIRSSLVEAPSAPPPAPAPAPAPTPAPPPPHHQVQVQHPFLGYIPGLSVNSNPFVYLTTPSVHRPCAQYATADSVQDFLSRVQQQQLQEQQQQQQQQQPQRKPVESKHGFQPLACRSRGQVDEYPAGGSSRSCEEDESDTQLHLGQPRPASDDNLPSPQEVDTGLQLKVAASASKTIAGAHAGS